KKEKKNAKEGAALGRGRGGKPAPAAAEDSEPAPSMIDLPLGHILSVERYPDGSSLYVKQIDVGKPETRTVCSGLVHYIPIEELQDRDVMVVPVTMRGVKSYVMLLCTSAKEGKDAGIELVNAPPGSKPGERIFKRDKFESAQSLPELNPKKNIFETVQPRFTTLDTLEEAWMDPAMDSANRTRTKDGCARRPSLRARRCHREKRVMQFCLRICALDDATVFGCTGNTATRHTVPPSAICVSPLGAFSGQGRMLPSCCEA
ncbi:nucleic acid-binding protein, partial [Calocera viscosa TUFC12733]